MSSQYQKDVNQVILVMTCLGRPSFLHHWRRCRHLRSPQRRQKHLERTEAFPVRPISEVGGGLEHLKFRNLMSMDRMCILQTRCSAAASSASNIQPMQNCSTNSQICVDRNFKKRFLAKATLDSNPRCSMLSEQVPHQSF